MDEATSALSAARRYVAAGFSVKPLRLDGSKAPMFDGTTYQERLPRDSELAAWYSRAAGVAIITGAVSGGLEVLDAEDSATAAAYEEAVNQAAPGLLARLPHVFTPGGGAHWYYRSVTLGKRQIFARKMNPEYPDDPKKAILLFELRAGGTYVAAPGSPLAVHENGFPYLWDDDGAPIEATPTLTNAEIEVLHEEARALDRMPPKAVLTGQVGTPGNNGTGDRPGDDFGHRTTWAEILEPHGWTTVGLRGTTTRWCRPGKTPQGTSATTDPTFGDVLYVFSSAAIPFEPEMSYTKFAAYALLDHDGDFRAAAKALRARGFGAPAPKPKTFSSGTGQATGARVDRETGEVSAAAPVGEFNLTDYGNAERIAALQGKDIRYCAVQKCWYIWDGKRWVEDKTEEITRKAKLTVRSFYAQAAGIEDDGARKTMVNHGKKCESASRIKAMIQLLQSEPEIAITIEDMDRDTWLFNTLDGTIDLRTGGLRPHRREDLITTISPVKWDPGARCEQWEDFLGTVLLGRKDLIDYVQRLLGYSMTGEISEQCLFLAHGAGSNGKSTFVDVVNKVMGDYSQNADPETFYVQKNPGVRTDLARLRWARLVTAVEGEQGRQLAEALVKQITGGDEMTARKLYSDEFNFVPKFKLLWGFNHKPSVRGTDNAIWRRIRLLPFDHQFPSPGQPGNVPAFAQRLYEELPGILQWMVRGCLSWQKEGLGIPDAVALETSSYREEEDLLGGWFSECCDIEAGNEESFTALYSAYKQYTEERNERPMSAKAFGRHLTERKIEGFKAAGNRSMRAGIALRFDAKYTGNSYAS